MNMAGHPKQRETIAAIATAPGMGGIGIVRISGERALEVADKMFVAASGTRVSEARAYQGLFGHVVEQRGAALSAAVDEAIALVMCAPHSYTAEDVVELQCHGGTLVLQTVLALTYRHGARPAEPGEFTKRAFLNGRIDLSQAESVMEVISAKSHASLTVASGRLMGAFAAVVGAWQHELISLIAHLDATIDYPEDDLEPALLTKVDAQLATLVAAVTKLRDTAAYGRVLRDGLATAIVGRPNVGKSSLLNALLREDRAIVTATPGTTRDTIEELASVGGSTPAGGVPLRLIDTAGIRETTDEVERIGVERSRSAMAQAALVLLLIDGSQPLARDDETILAALPATSKTLLLLTKSDLPQALSIGDVRRRLPLAPAGILAISAKTGDGMPELEGKIAEIAHGTVTGDTALTVNAREAQLLDDIAAHLTAARQTICDGLPSDFVVIDLRSALERLGELTGDNASDAVIDEIFSKFCVGK